MTTGTRPAGQAPLVLGGRDVDGLLLDVDDTLVDTRAAFRHALAEAFTPLAPQAADCPGAIVAQWRRDAGGHYRAYTRGELGYHDQRRARVAEILAQLGGPRLDEAGYGRWSDVFDQAFARAWRPWPDAAALAPLAAAGLRLGAVTNAPSDMQRAKLAAVGLAKLVPLLVTVDTLGIGKPAPEVFHEGARLLGTEPGRTAYVGDEADIDANAAARAGLVGIWLRRPGHEETGAATGLDPGVITIDSLAEIGALAGRVTADGATAGATGP